MSRGHKSQLPATRSQIGMLNFVTGESPSSGYSNQGLTRWMASNLINTLKPEELVARAPIESYQCPACKVWFSGEDAYDNGWTCPCCKADIFNIQSYLGSLPDEKGESMPDDHYTEIATNIQNEEVIPFEGNALVDALRNIRIKV